LVLAGAGAAGNAWEIGLIAGLSNAGVDATEADLITGTSAGSTVAAQITSGTRPAELFAAILAEVPQSRTGAVGSDRGRAPNWSGANYMEWSNGIIDAAEDAADMRRRMGAAALEMDAASDSSAQTQWRATVAARLLSHHWPQRPVLITAVDAHTGEPVVFDRHSGIDLVDAVAASTTNGFGPFPPYRIGDNRYINGGYRRSENADLAAGYGRVLVLSPFGGRSRCRWTGAWISQPRSTNCAQMAAESRLFSRIAAPATYSTSMRWIRRRVCRPREAVTTKAEPLPSSSPNSGADALKSVDSVDVTTPAHASDGRWARHVSRYLPAPRPGLVLPP